jgi:hypothetical protein
MAHSLPFSDTRLQFETPQPPEPTSPPEPHLPPTKNINAAPKTALLVENDKILLNFFETVLDGRGVRGTYRCELRGGTPFVP